ncbi:MAG: type II toxin-antitoxin system VapC family toxin [Spirochaetota bacterium]
MRGDESRILIDTNILIYATLENDSRFARSREVLLAQDDRERFVSVQNLAEMYPDLTGPKMEKPDDPATARAKIQSIAALACLQVLPLTADVQSVARELCEKHGITRQHYCDAQIAATMIVHGIGSIITENTGTSGIPRVQRGQSLFDAAKNRRPGADPRAPEGALRRYCALRAPQKPLIAAIFRFRSRPARPWQRR